MKNSNSHVILYSKSWYKKTDTIEDLKIIYGHRSGIEPRFMSKQKIADNLLRLCYKYVKLNSYLFADFILSMAPDQRWKHFGYEKNKDYEFYLSVIERCLSFLSILQIKDNDKDGELIEILVPLDEPDYSILPRGYSKE